MSQRKKRMEGFRGSVAQTDRGPQGPEWKNGPFAELEVFRGG